MNFTKNIIAFLLFASFWGVVFPVTAQVDTIGVETTVHVYPDPNKGMYLDLRVDTIPSPKYTWYKDGMVIQGINTGVYQTQSVSMADIGAYDADIIDGNGKMYYHRPINVGLKQIALDSIGGEYSEDEFVVRFVPSTPQATKDAIRLLNGATLIDTCLCDIELWRMFDSAVSPEDKKNQASSSPEIESVDFNYVVDSHARPQSNWVNESAMQKALTLEKITAPSSVLVATIDAGISHNHPVLLGKTWVNSDEAINGSDNDFNCIEDEVIGFDFGNWDTDPNETIWKHGSHVSGLIDTFSTGNAIQMDLKVFGIQLKTSLFKISCATYYAVQKKAKVINMSWGWQGLPALILENAIEAAGNDCGALVVCSAGNDFSSNDATPHFPSGYLLNNILEVAADSVTNIDEVHGIMSYSNYGGEVDVAVHGAWLSTVPGDTWEVLTGTSMSAAVMSGVAAKLFSERPDANWLDVKNCILSNSQSDPNLLGYVNNELWFSTDFMLLNAVSCINATVVDPDSCPVTVIMVGLDDLVIPMDAVGSMQVFPNPFTGEVRFEFDLERNSPVLMTITDALGRQIYSTHSYKITGENQIFWDGTELSTGIYFCNIYAEGAYFVQKLVKN